MTSTHAPESFTLHEPLACSILYGVLAPLPGQCWEIRRWKAPGATFYSARGLPAVDQLHQCNFLPSLGSTRHQSSFMSPTWPPQVGKEFLSLWWRAFVLVYVRGLDPALWCQYSLKVRVSVAQSCLILCDFMDCSPPGSSFHEVLQGRILEWVAMPFSRGSSRSRDWTQISCIAGGFFTVWATRR